MTDFSPGIASMKADGIHATTSPYPEGSAGIQLSLDVMAQKMRDGRIDSRVRRWAGEQLAAAGIDGRGHPTVRQRTQVLLDAIRAQVVYSPDPVGTEYIPSAAATLCLDPKLCVKIEDCDGLSTALGSATMSLGIPTQIVKQSFGSGAQQHVLIAVEDEQGQWLRADPSTRLPVGQAAHAQSEEWIDPMAGAGGGTMGTSGAEIVTLGLAHSRTVHHGRWWEHKYGQWWVYDREQWIGMGNPGDGTPWTLVSDGHIRAGLRYKVDFVATSIGTDLIVEAYANMGQPVLAKRFTDAGWSIETLSKTGSVTGGVDSWELVGISKTDQVLANDVLVSYTNVWVQASAVTPVPAPTPAPIVPAATTPPASSSVSGVAVFVGLLAAGAVGGVGYGMYRRHKKLKRAA